ncbi:hypothetical protein [Sphingomonas morindae]|uniref:Signal transduction histidine kinase n=1 Tax=Sphingomonas morindae TaxID=1541170 RepID=A0ABY4XB63_9SPHN|nr:hypothetical protein [Sphingomonas morindae]USI73931.1 hypothetical protein LHA26_05550 [Sphingomonas morindae]
MLDQTANSCGCPEAIYARELSHRANNALQGALAAMHLGRRGGAGLDYAVQRLEGVIALNRALGPDRAGVVETEKVIRQVCAAVVKAAGSEDVDVIVSADTIWAESHRVRPLLMVIAELVGNAISHAFPEGAGTVLVSLRDSGRSARLVVEDDGICGGWDRPGGQGRGIVDAFAAHLGGRVRRGITSGGSSRIVVILPTIALVAYCSEGRA